MNYTGFVLLELTIQQGENTTEHGKTTTKRNNQ
jgi:hypothetical protein